MLQPRVSHYTENGLPEATLALASMISQDEPDEDMPICVCGVSGIQQFVGVM